MKNANERKGLPKNIDLLIQIAISVVKEAKDNNTVTRRTAHLEKLANSVNSDYQKLINNK